jgi:hypothetical protein
LLLHSSENIVRKQHFILDRMGRTEGLRYCACWSQ